ncbi:MAG: AAA family ATPase, partial [Anaerostipes hadrus]
MEETVTILKGIKYRFEDYHRILVPEDVTEAIASLSDRYISDRFLPDKAIDLLDEACARKRMAQAGSQTSFKEERKEITKVINEIEEALSDSDITRARELKAQKNKLEKSLERKMKRTNKKQNEIPSLTIEDAAEVVSLWTQIPVTQLTKGDMERLRHLEKELHKYVIGQDEAVQAVAKAVKRSRVGLKSPNRPIGSFLFLGPTGVGNTELSKTLTRALFGREEDLIRVDMSE